MKAVRSIEWRYFVAPVAGSGAGLLPTWLLLNQRDPTYDVVLFVLVPLIVGFVTSGVAMIGRQAVLSKLFTISLFGLILFGVGILGFAMDGMICVALAAPLALAPLLLGCWLAKEMFGPKYVARDPKPFLMVAFLVGVGAWDRLVDPNRATQVEFASSVDIAASPQRVWKQILSLDVLPPADDWVSKLGMACPQTTKLKGQGVGSVRECTLSTGHMNERITVWQPERRLGFVALNTPPPMTELNPFREVHPAHLTERYYRVLYGEFRLEPLADGRTRLSRITRYEHRIGPARYWTFWTNQVAFVAHRRVLDFLKAQSESSDQLARQTRPNLMADSPRIANRSLQTANFSRFVSPLTNLRRHEDRRTYFLIR